jgi:hypothetical protein
MKKKHKKDNQLNYEIIPNYELTPMHNVIEENYHKFSYLILHTGHISTLMRKNNLQKLANILNKYKENENGAVKCVFITGVATYDNKIQIMLFDKTLKNHFRPNKIDYLLNLFDTYRGSMVFEFDPAIYDVNAQVFANHVLDIRYCVPVTMRDMSFHYDIFNTNKINMNHRYFSDMLMLLDKHLPRDISTIVSDYIEKINAENANAVIIDWYCEDLH